MKALRYKTIVLCFSVFMLLALSLSVLAQTSKLSVHEWGTFTTLHASDGTRLSGLEVEEEKLPNFVYDFSKATAPSDSRYKGLPASSFSPEKLRNITVKMETPVIYFYGDQQKKVSVRIDFPQGLISQWYPHLKDGNSVPENWDFANPYKGWMEWEVEVLSPQAIPTPPKEQETKTWIAPRATQANSIKSLRKEEVEKFIFYRGMANFLIPLEVKFHGTNVLDIKNTDEEKMPYVLVYEKTEDGDEKIWWQGKLGASASRNIDLSKRPKKANFARFKRALVAAGLYKDEASAMLKTWEDSYFEKPGLRVFWILPEAKVNEILPMTITPEPKNINRVFVGRADILSPSFEAALFQEYESDNELTKYAQDRYYKGYLERAIQ